MNIHLDEGDAFEFVPCPDTPTPFGVIRLGMFGLYLDSPAVARSLVVAAALAAEFLEKPEGAAPQVPARAKACESCGATDTDLLDIRNPTTNLMETHCREVGPCYDRRYPKCAECGFATPGHLMTCSHAPRHDDYAPAVAQS